MMHCRTHWLVLPPKSRGKRDDNDVNDYDDNDINVWSMTIDDHYTESSDV